MPRTANQMRKRERTAANHLIADIFLLCKGKHGNIHTIQKCRQVKGLFLQDDFIGFQIPHVQDAVYQLQQNAKCHRNIPAAALQKLSILRVFGRHIDIALNSVDGCADVMADASQKISLCVIRNSCFVDLIDDLRLIVCFPRLILVNILNQRQDVTRLSGFIKIYRRCRNPAPWRSVSTNGLVIYIKAFAYI